MTVTLLHGDCREVLATLPAESVDACVCDPPYGLEFMGRDWDAPWKAGDIAMRRNQSMDGVNTGLTRQGGRQRACADYQKRQARDMRTYQAWCEEWAAEVLRTLKPGAHLAAFGGTRTFHRMMCAIEDAGFEIRDTLMWVYGSGFPKSHNQPGGLGTALKPAWEPIVLARKPLAGTVAANVAAHGTGALNIDATRVPTDDKLGGGGQSSATKVKVGGWGRPWMHDVDAKAAHAARVNANVAKAETLGRWPANLAHDGSDEVLEAFAAFGISKGSDRVRRNTAEAHNRTASMGKFASDWTTGGYSDTGTAARFFFSAKASKAERGEGNTHPTVKPLALMQWLCRLVTPPGGTVLDPFAGSGSTLIAAAREGFDCIGIEREAEYIEIARRRIAGDAPLFAEVA